MAQEWDKWEIVRIQKKRRLKPQLNLIITSAKGEVSYDKSDLELKPLGEEVNKIRRP